MPDTPVAVFGRAVSGSFYRQYLPRVARKLEATESTTETIVCRVMTIISRSQFASELGITRTAINHYIGRGMPCIKGRGVDRNVARRWVKANIKPQVHLSKALRSGNPSVVDAVQQRARRDKEAADKLALENQRTRERTCELSFLERLLPRLFAAVRCRLLVIGGEVAAKLAREPSAEVCREIIEAAVRQALEDLAEGGSNEQLARSLR